MKLLRSIFLLLVIIALGWTLKNWVFTGGNDNGEPAAEQAREGFQIPWVGDRITGETPQPEYNGETVFYDKNGDGYPDMPANSVQVIGRMFHGCGEVLTYLHGWGRNWVPTSRTGCREYYFSNFLQDQG